MRFLSMATLAGGTLLAASLTAGAADLPVQQPAYKAPVAAPILDTWTGCYLGGNLGGSWGSGDLTDTFGTISRSGHDSGFVGGGQIGCDLQTGAWVFGIRDMFDWANRNRTGVITGGPLTGFNATLKNEWVDLLTGRIGYTVTPGWLFYFQGGAAWRESKLEVFNPIGVQLGSASKTRTGWTVGGGSEWKFAPNWSVFLEYDFADFGSRSLTVVGPAGVGDTITAKSNLQMFLIGLNWRPKF
jgi:outer membrane immunogenic protein